MRRFVTFTVAWLFAAVAATTAAWQGVALVTDEVTDNRPAALAASDVQERLDAATSPSASVTTTAGTASSTTTVPATTAPSTTTTAVPSETHTYHLDGGTTTLEFSPAGVREVVSTPNPGFSVKTEPEGDGLRVEFESDSHRSRIDASWDNGPQVRPREDKR
jgi:hypothetical protein